METILITGCEGFIGKHLAKAFYKNGYTVISVDIKESSSKFDLKHYKIDITKPEFETVFKENNIDYVIHLAAHISVQNSINDPIFDAKENIIGTLNVLKMCKKYKIKKIIGASTAAVYGEPKYLPLKESSILNPLSPYAVSKIAMENYIKLSGVNYIIFRYSNIYGFGQSTKGECGVAAIFAERMLKNDAVIIYGDGNQVRDFIFIEDVVELNLKSIKSEFKNITLNFSNNKEVTVNELFKELSALTGYNKKPVYKPERKGDILKNVLDNKSVSSLYSPKISFRDGLSDMVTLIKKGVLL